MDGTVTSEGQIALCNPHRVHLINWPSLQSSLSLCHSVFSFFSLIYFSFIFPVSFSFVLLYFFLNIGVLIASTHPHTHTRMSQCRCCQVWWNWKWEWGVSLHAFTAVRKIQSRRSERIKWGPRQSERCWLGSSEEDGGFHQLLTWHPASSITVSSTWHGSISHFHYAIIKNSQEH